MKCTRRSIEGDSGTWQRSRSPSVTARGLPLSSWERQLESPPSANEALVIDQTIADVTDDNAVLVATDTTRDSLLVDDVITSPRSANDLAVEVGALFEYPAEVRM
jgi:hypothetical protein